jgi:hypothetical protein
MEEQINQPNEANEVNQTNQIDTQITQITDIISRLENKDFNIYYFTLDTKGNPTAGIANIYEHVKILNNLGFNASILHEKDDYKRFSNEDQTGVNEWLGEEYANLPHASIEGQQLNISPADFIIIPEIFANIMDQVKAFPCRKIVLSQSYDYLLELLPIGKRWNIDYGFNDVITTSERQAEYLRNLFPSINTHVIPVSIPSYFTDSDKPKVPIVCIHTRNQGEAAKIAKSFYLQYPVYKWITFKELRGLSRRDFATELGKSCLSVWIDDAAGFGTFPLESIECGTTVIGKIPNLVPEWMETTDENGTPVIKNNGVWTNTTVNIPELIATFLKIWLEDSVPSDLTEGMLSSQGQYTCERQERELSEVYSRLLNDRILELQSNLARLEEAKENTNA